MQLCIWNNNKCNRIQLKNFQKSPQCKIEDFKNIAASSVENINNYVLVYKGCVLNNERYMEDYDISPDAEIILLNKNPEPESKKYNFGLDELQTMSISYLLMIKKPKFSENALKIINSFVFEDMKNLYPEVTLDTTALGILSDPELIEYLADIETLKSIYESHPVVIACANYLFQYFCDQNTLTKQPPASSSYSYSLEELSDEDFEGENVSHNQGSTNQTTPGNSITRAQLSQALVNASYHAQLRSLTFDTPSTSRGPTERQSQPNENTTNNGTETRNDKDLSKKYASQLKIMKDMGMMLEDINIRALEAAEGDIERAVEFVINESFVFLSQNRNT